MLLYLLSVFVFAVTDSLNRLAVANSDFLTFLFFRALFAILIHLAIFVPSSGWAALRPKNPKWVFVTGLVVCATGFGYTYIFNHMPMAEAYAIGYIYPLIAIFVSIPLLGDRVKWPHIAASIVGFLGVSLVFAPAFSADAKVTWVWGLCIFINVLYGVYLVLTGWLAKTEEKTVLLLAGTVTSLAITALLLLIQGGFIWPTPLGWALTIGITIATVIGRYLIVWGLAMASASSVAPFDYLSIAFVALFGWLLYSEVPGNFTWFGAAIVAVACLFIYRTPQHVQHGAKQGWLN